MEQPHNGTTEQQHNSTTAQNNSTTATAEKKHTDASAFTHEKRGTRRARAFDIQQHGEHFQSSASFEVANLSQFLLVVEQFGPHARPRCEVIFMI